MQPADDVVDIENRLFLDAIYARYGYDLRDYARPSMRRRLAVALAKSGLPNMGELQHRVLTDADLFATVLDDLLVRVTEMFRDPAFHLAFRQQVVPLLRTYPQIKIWHAGCASGEEVYANAVLLAEEGLYQRAQIYATDISASAISVAREGVYAAGAPGAFAEGYRLAGGTKTFDDYVLSAYGSIAIRDSLRKNVVFFQHNLVSDYTLGEMHVIFCRNVLIYFGTELRGRVLGMFGESLCGGGFLCLGGSENVPASQAALFVEHAPPARIYRRSRNT